MAYRTELVSLGIAALGGIVAAYATVYEPVSRNVSLWISYIGAAIVLFAPWLYAQQKYWEEDAANATATRGMLTPGNGTPTKVRAIMQKYPDATGFVLLADSMVVVTRKAPHTIVAQDGEDMLVVGERAGGVTISGRFFDQFGDEICSLDNNSYELKLPEGYESIARRHELAIIQKESSTTLKIELVNNLVVRLSGDFHLRGGEPMSVGKVVDYAQRSFDGFTIDMPSPTFRLEGHELFSGPSGNGPGTTINMEEVRRTGVLQPTYIKVHNPAGIYWITTLTSVVRDEWYLAANCKSCGKPIYLFNDPREGRDPAPFTGDGRLKFDCPRCGELAEYETSDIVPVKSKENLSFPSTTPTGKAGDDQKQSSGDEAG